MPARTSRTSTSKKARVEPQPAPARKSSPSRKSTPAMRDSSPSSRPTRPSDSARAKTSSAPLPEIDPAAYPGKTLDRLQAKWHPPSTAEAVAFRSLYDDELCTRIGAQTKSAEVLADAVRIVHVADRAKSSYPAALDGYSAVRFGFLLACVRALHEEIEVSLARREGKSGARSALEAATSRGEQVRNDVVSHLRSFAGHRKAESAALAAAMESDGSAAQLAGALQKLAYLAREWLSRTDEVSHILARSAKLSPEGVHAALAAADAITTALMPKDAAAPDARATDSAEVNVAEGRVVVELRELFRLFREARARSPMVPELLAGPGTQRVLGGAIAPAQGKAAAKGVRSVASG